MDLKRIGQFCKKAKTIRITYHPKSASLWIGNGKAMWLADEGIEINRKNCGALLDVDDGDFEVAEGDTDLAYFDGNALYENKDAADVLGCGMMGGKAFLALNRGGECKVALIPLEYAKAATKEEDYRNYFLVGSEEYPVAAITDGLNLKMLVRIEGAGLTREFIGMAQHIGEMEPFKDDTEDEQTQIQM